MRGRIGRGYTLYVAVGWQVVDVSVSAVYCCVSDGAS